MKEFTLEEFKSMVDMLGTPEYFENGTIGTLGDNPNWCEIIQRQGDIVKSCTFSLHRVNEYEVHWQPTEKIVIISEEEAPCGVGHGYKSFKSFPKITSGLIPIK